MRKRGPPNALNRSLRLSVLARPAISHRAFNAACQRMHLCFFNAAVPGDYLFNALRVDRRLGRGRQDLKPRWEYPVPFDSDHPRSAFFSKHDSLIGSVIEAVQQSEENIECPKYLGAAFGFRFRHATVKQPAKIGYRFWAQSIFVSDPRS